MTKELNCFERLENKNYLTERERKEFLNVVKAGLLRLKEFDDLLAKYSIPNVEYLEKCIQDHDKYGETMQKRIRVNKNEQNSRNKW